MASGHPALTPEIGPDGLARDSPVIAYTEKIIEAEQLQLKKYIQENYSKIRDVERELESLNLEMKLTAGPKKAALEHLRKKIEIATERIRVAKLKEEQAKKAWEAAQQALKDEEAAKQKLCDDLNNLVQESAASQYARLEELKKRLEALNPSKISAEASPDKTQIPASIPAPATVQEPTPANISTTTPQNPTNISSNKVEAQNQRRPTTEAKEKRKPQNSGRGGRGSLILSKGSGNGGSGWTGAGFDVDLNS
ncbi:hypothetical protein LUZ61_013644 [Rhynchospora tenuis]|uniref:RAB6-interacting golgin n=1 Tax=Rhynchospora tenuis TaxID=198213 RepID=A0AAD5W9T2_9POAL|nr:hypothetical protein LUZ61_013644 [Rhynchospora tenuis]